MLSALPRQELHANADRRCPPLSNDSIKIINRERDSWLNPDTDYPPRCISSYVVIVFPHRLLMPTHSVTS